ncbi:MAG: arabinosyltransferase domain-containing protein [Pseudonocardiaceae bacterium]
MPYPVKSRHGERTRVLSAESPIPHPPVSTALALLVGLAGVLVALVLPFAPVTTEQTTVTWPAPGQPVVSSAALFAPYRPTELTVTVPCSALRAVVNQDHPVTVLATGPPDDGLVLRTAAGVAQLLLGPRLVASTPVTDTTNCRTQLHAGPAGAVATIGTRKITLAAEPVPRVFAFRTDLNARDAAGMAVTARAASPFATSPTGVKTLLIALQLLAALAALALLTGRPAGRALVLGVWRWDVRTAGRAGNWTTAGRAGNLATVLVDIGVLGVLAGWAIIGPLTDDDGFAATIARNAALTGNVGNYYRWWNASETPFALSEQLLAPLTQVSLAPLWLRVPSTVLGMVTWFVVSRGVLGAALPAVAGTVRIRLLAAVFLLAAWLPFNLGVRPEPYVALGVTGVLALLWRARGPAALGWAALVAGLTIPVSPGGIVVAAPVLVFAPRVVALIRGSARGRVEVLAMVLLLCCIGAVGLTAIFADQTWDGLVTATHWHEFFGPSLPWYHEPDRYRFLLSDDQGGSATKRIPVLLTLAVLPVVGVLLARRTLVGPAEGSAARLTGVVITALALLWLTPSKWSHHFGALAGVFASFLVVAVALVLSRKPAPVGDPAMPGIGVAGAGLVAGAAGLAFAGPNAWWQAVVYDVPWRAGPVRPIGLPLDSPLLWIGALALSYSVLIAPLTLAALRPVLGVGPQSTADMHREAVRLRAALVRAPAVLVVAATGTAVAVLLGSFLAAPMRQPAGSLALANLHSLAGGPSCGLADSIQVLPDGAVLTPATGSVSLYPGLELPAPAPPERLAGFTALAGFDPGSPPPDPPGIGMSAQLWGSLVGGPRSTGSLTSPWFRLPTFDPAGGVAVSVSGRTDRGNKLIFEFGRAASTGVVALGQRTPADRVRPNQDHLDGPPDYRPWRAIGLDAAQVPARADRVRIRAVDASTDPAGWLAVTGPRLRSVVGLTPFLAGHGPVLVSWPQAFLFPCVHNIAGVTGGLATAPRAVIEAPRVHGRGSAVTTDQSQGGVFAAIRPYSRLYEVATRLKDHPDADWGTLQLPADPAFRDTYLSRHGDISGSDPDR